MKDVDGDVKRDICAGFYLFNANFPQLIWGPVCQRFTGVAAASVAQFWSQTQNFTAHCLAHVHRAVFVLYFRANRKYIKMRSGTVWAATDYNIYEHVQTGGFRRWVSDHEKGDSFQEKQLPLQFISSQSIILPLNL